MLASKKMNFKIVGIVVYMCNISLIPIPGKYVPAIAYKIHSENKNSPQIRINLKGLAIGNGLTDPISQLGYGEVLFHLGLIDTKQRSFVAEQEAKSEQLILQGNYSEAYEVIFMAET